MLKKINANYYFNSSEIVNPMVYVVMEVGDTDLSHLTKSIIQEKKKIPLATILYYWMDMLTAVQHIHKEGICIVQNF